MQYSTYYLSSLGKILLTSDGENLTGLWYEGQKYYAATVKEQVIEKPELPLFITVKEWLDRYFSGKKPAVSELPLKPEGTEFRKIVLKILCEIPYGKTLTYGEVAKIAAARMGKTTMSSQAVGGAVGHNPIAIIIPCHRVVGTNGSLTGFASGIDKKIKLLEIEKVDMKKFFVPTKGTAL